MCQIDAHLAKHSLTQSTWPAGNFELVVMGKNGVFVSGEPVMPGNPPVALSSGTLISICDTSFWFLLPKKPKPGPDSRKRARY